MNPSGLQQHEKGATISYECIFCKAMFFQLKPLLKHMRSHSSGKCFECSICQKKYSTEIGWIVHKKQHTKFIYDCEYCDESFKLRSELKHHAFASHESVLKMYQCAKCSDAFPTKSLLQCHSNTHDQAYLMEQHLCSECGKTFTNKTIFKEHQKVHSSDRPFACTQCPSKFKKRAYLNEHMLMHTGEKRYVCDICNKAFTMKTALDSHKS